MFGLKFVNLLLIRDGKMEQSVTINLSKVEQPTQ